MIRANHDIRKAHLNKLIQVVLQGKEDYNIIDLVHDIIFSLKLSEHDKKLSAFYIDEFPEINDILNSNKDKILKYFLYNIKNYHDHADHYVADMTSLIKIGVEWPEIGIILKSLKG